MAKYVVGWALSGTTEVEAESQQAAEAAQAEYLEGLAVEGGEYAMVQAHGSTQFPHRRIFEGNPGNIPG